jgi:hypothetical protein
MVNSIFSAPIYGGRAMGMSTGMVVVVNQLKDFQSTKVSGADNVLQNIVNHLPVSDKCHVPHSHAKGGNSHHQITYQFSRPVSQGNFEEIESLSKAFQSAYGNLPKTVVLVDPLLAEYSTHHAHKLFAQVRKMGHLLSEFYF